MNISRGLEYTVIENGVAILRGIGNCLDEHIVVPSTVQGYPVVGVAEKAFERNDVIKSITLPCSVENIGKMAFAWCRNLESVRAEGVICIDNRAFMGCDRLQILAFGDYLETIGDKVFSYCAFLTSLTLPRHTETIGTAAFEGCRNLKKIILPSAVKIIENSTFYACTSLWSVKLPNHLEYIDEYAFAYCISITEMNLSPKTVVNNDAFFECGKLLGDGKVS